MALRHAEPEQPGRRAGRRNSRSGSSPRGRSSPRAARTSRAPSRRASAISSRLAVAVRVARAWRVESAVIARLSRRRGEELAERRVERVGRLEIGEMAGAGQGHEARARDLRAAMRSIIAGGAIASRSPAISSVGHGDARRARRAGRRSARHAERRDRSPRPAPCCVHGARRSRAPSGERRPDEPRDDRRRPARPSCAPRSSGAEPLGDEAPLRTRRPAAEGRAGGGQRQSCASAVGMARRELLRDHAAEACPTRCDRARSRARRAGAAARRRARRSSAARAAAKPP